MKIAKRAFLYFVVTYFGIFFLFTLLFELYARYWEENRVDWAFHAAMLNEPNTFPWVNPLRRFGTYWSTSLPDTNIVSGGETGNYVTYQSDRYGLKNPDRDLPNIELDALVVGDSFSMARSVDLAHSWYRLMETEKGILSYSIAMGGTGVLQSYFNVLKFLPVAKPKFLIWGFYSNDFTDSVREHKAGIIYKYIGEKFENKNFNIFRQSYRNEIKFIRHKMSEKLEWYRNPFRLRLIRLVKYIYYIYISPIISKVEGVTPISQRIVEKVLLEAVNFSRANDANFVLLFFPSPGDVLLPNQSDFLKKRKILKDIAEANKIIFIDFTKIILSLDNPLDAYINIPNNILNYPYGHFSAIGNKLVADHVAKTLNTRE